MIGRSSQPYFPWMRFHKFTVYISLRTCLSIHSLLSKFCACSRTPAEEDWILTLALYPKSSILAWDSWLGRKSLSHIFPSSSHVRSAWRSLFLGLSPWIATILCEIWVHLLLRYDQGRILLDLGILSWHECAQKSIRLRNISLKCVITGQCGLMVTPGLTIAADGITPCRGQTWAAEHAKAPAHI